jgi:hypothetical protein
MQASLSPSLSLSHPLRAAPPAMLPCCSSLEGSPRSHGTRPPAGTATWPSRATRLAMPWPSHSSRAARKRHVSSPLPASRVVASPPLLAEVQSSAAFKQASSGKSSTAGEQRKEQHGKSSPDMACQLHGPAALYSATFGALPFEQSTIRSFGPGRTGLRSRLCWRNNV